MAAKLVRLRNRHTGVVVQTSEDNTTRLADYEPVDAKTTTKKQAPSSSSKSSSK